MNRAELVAALSADFSGNHADAERAPDALLRVITYEIAGGRFVSIAGFGTFETATRPDRVITNPETGKQRRIKGLATPQFRAAAELKAYAAGLKKPPKPSKPVISRRSASARASRLVSDRGAHDLIRHLIDFDPRRPGDYLFAAAPDTDLAATYAAQQPRPPAIPWPEGFAPTPSDSQPHPTPTSPLPQADVLIVTFTTAEARAVADVLTPGTPLTRWHRYRNGWQQLKQTIDETAPSRQHDQAGRWTTTRIGSSTVLVVKCDLHPLTDGSKFPIVPLWRQMIAQVQPQLIVTTGTAQAVHPDTVPGDVFVSRHARGQVSGSDPQPPWNSTAYSSNVRFRPGQFRLASRTLLRALSEESAESRRPPRIQVDSSRHRLTMATVDQVVPDPPATPQLESLGGFEFTDATLGHALHGLTDPPGWVSVRGIHSAIGSPSNTDPADAKRAAATDYEHHGYAAAVNAAIACWSLVMGLPNTS